MSPPPAQPGMAWASLALGLLLMFSITAYPRALVDAAGKPDHLAATLAAWAMAAGLVRGVGFVPRNGLLRIALSGWASALACCLALLRLYLVRG